MVLPITSFACLYLRIFYVANDLTWAPPGRHNGQRVWDAARGLHRALFLVQGCIHGAVDRRGEDVLEQEASE